MRATMRADLGTAVRAAIRAAMRADLGAAMSGAMRTTMRTADSNRRDDYSLLFQLKAEAIIMSNNGSFLSDPLIAAVKNAAMDKIVNINNIHRK